MGYVFGQIKIDNCDGTSIDTWEFAGPITNAQDERIRYYLDKLVDVMNESKRKKKAMKIVKPDKV